MLTHSDTGRPPLHHRLTTWVYGCLFLLTLLGPRYDVILRNVLWWDDFAVPRQTVLTYLGSYRPVMYVEYWFWETLVPGHFWRGLPKFLGLAYALAALLLLDRFLRRLGVPRLVAVASGLLIAVHPIVTDGLFWSSLRGMGLGLVFVVLAVDLLWFGESLRSRILGFVFLTLGVLTYQWLLSAAGVLLLAAAGISYLRGDIVGRKRLLVSGLSLFGAAVVMVAGTEASRAILEHYDARGWAAASSLAESVRRRYHGWADNWVNVFMPPLAAIAGYRRAWSLWKWVPLFWTVLATIAAVFAGFRRGRLLVACLLPVGLSAAASAFTLLLPFGTYSWRTSLAALIGFSAGLAACGVIAWDQRIGRVIFGLASGAFLLAAAFATHVDDVRRASGYFHAIRQEQEQDLGDDFGGYALTIGYTPMTRSEYTPYADEWVAQNFRRYLRARTDPRTLR